MADLNAQGFIPRSFLPGRSGTVWFLEGPGQRLIQMKGRRVLRQVGLRFPGRSPEDLDLSDFAWGQDGYVWILDSKGGKVWKASLKSGDATPAFGHFLEAFSLGTDAKGRVLVLDSETRSVVAFEDSKVLGSVSSKDDAFPLANSLNEVPVLLHRAGARKMGFSLVPLSRTRDPAKAPLGRLLGSIEGPGKGLIHKAEVLALTDSKAYIRILTQSGRSKRADRHGLWVLELGDKDISDRTYFSLPSLPNDCLYCQPTLRVDSAGKLWGFRRKGSRVQVVRFGR